MAEIILTVTTVLSLVAFSIAINDIKKLLTKNKELRIELEKQKRNCSILASHAAEMARIERSNRELKSELKGAKNDEEIANIVNAVIDANNRRMQDVTKN